MKKIVLFILMMLPVAVMGQVGKTFKVKDVNGNKLECIVTSPTTVRVKPYDYKEKMAKVIIPERVKNYTVTEIEGFDEYKGVESHTVHFNRRLAEITIPGTVVSVGSFSGCNLLQKVILPSSVREISEGAFRECENLESVTIPQNVDKIKKYTFFDCKKLSSITIPESVTEIKENAFGWCRNLTSIVIPSSVKKIEEGAFAGCSGLTSVTFNCKVIGDWFKGNQSIKEIIIGDSVTSIGRSAFENCKNLVSVVISNGVSEIEECAFSECVNLKSINIPESVTTIKPGAFEGCYKVLLKYTPKFKDTPSPTKKDDNYSIFDFFEELEEVVNPLGFGSRIK